MTMTGEIMQPTVYELSHDDQLIRFEGVLLGSASSEETARAQGKRNWHEVQLYCTIDGRYVVAKIGHTTVPGQVKRSTVQVSETAQGAIECLQTIDPDGVMYMTRVARNAVLAASINDAAIHKAYSIRNLTA